MNPNISGLLSLALDNPEKKPNVSHFEGTDLVIEHVEENWCPSFHKEKNALRWQTLSPGGRRPYQLRIVPFVAFVPFRGHQLLWPFDVTRQERRADCRNKASSFFITQSLRHSNFASVYHSGRYVACRRARHPARYLLAWGARAPRVQCSAPSPNARSGLRGRPVQPRRLRSPR